MDLKNHEPTERLLRLCDVLKIIPMSASSWWAGVKSGKLPQPLRLGERMTVWRSTDIENLISSLDEISPTEDQK